MLMFVPGRGWYRYDPASGTWVPTSSITPDVLFFTKQMYNDAFTCLGAYPTLDNQRYAKHAERCRSAKATTQIAKLAEAELAVDAGALNDAPHLLNTPAGVYDLRQGVAYPHSPAYRCTQSTAVSPSWTSPGDPLWREFLATITEGDAELARYLQVVAGMALVGRVYHEGILIFFGRGSNGKSTFLEALSRVLGSYAITVNADILTLGPRLNIGANAATLEGRRLAVTGELERNARLSSAAVKRLTSTDTIVAEEKYKAPRSFVPSHTLIMATNYLPEIDHNDAALHRRLSVVPFNATIPEESAVPNFTSLLIDRAGDAILAWAIIGAQMYLAHGSKLPPCAAVAEATSSYIRGADWLGMFLGDHCVHNPGAKVSGGELYDLYVLWSNAYGYRVRSQREFCQAMEAAGFRHTYPGNVSTWHGIGLPVVPDDPDAPDACEE